MTVDVVRRARRRAPARDAAPEPSIATTASIAIGEINQTVFDCPACARPLALGARRCPGCGTRLVNGVTLGKVSAFVAVGLAVGLLLGAGGGLVVGLNQAGAAPAAGPSAIPAAGGGNGNGGGAVVGSSSPAATAAATATASAAPTPTTTSGIPPVARSALVQVAATNGRLAIAAASLTDALAARAFDASAVAQTLRTVSADSVFGEQLADRVGMWSGSATLAGQLASFYGAIHDTAADGLVASVQNTAAYRSAATAMVKLLDGVPAVDAAVAAVAAAGGVDLPLPSGAPIAP